MAARPKRESRPPKSFIDEVEQPKPYAMKKKKPKKDSNLYDIEVPKWTRTNWCTKIHFVGHGNEFDEWRDSEIDSDQLSFVRLEKIYVPDKESLEDRKQLFHGNLYGGIKRKLWSGRKEDQDGRSSE